MEPEPRVSAVNAAASGSSASVCTAVAAARTSLYGCVQAGVTAGASFAAAVVSGSEADPRYGMFGKISVLAEFIVLFRAVL